MPWWANAPKAEMEMDVLWSGVEGRGVGTWRLETGGAPAKLGSTRGDRVRFCGRP